MSRSKYNDIFQQGRKAFFDYIPLSKNPFKENSDEFYCWKDGYAEAERGSFGDEEKCQQHWDKFLESEEYEYIMTMSSERSALCFVFKIVWRMARRCYGSH